MKQYFPEEVVIRGLFRVAEELYSVKFVLASAPPWHPDVRLRSARSRSVPQFYMDLYARETKRGGAWMDDAISRRRKAERIQIPVAYLNCNSRPVGGKPALFTHDEVLTLFHEFGTGDHLLTQVERSRRLGISGVEWDAVELPSQFMENFWEWDVLREMTRHVDTDQPLQDHYLRKCWPRRISRAGSRCCARSSSRCSTCGCIRTSTRRGRSALDLLQEVRKQVAVLFPPAYNRFPNSRPHLRRRLRGRLLQLQVGRGTLRRRLQSCLKKGGAEPRRRRALRDEILAVGGSRPAAESFRAFRGREPNVEALLRHNGMIAA